MLPQSKELLMATELPVEAEYFSSCSVTVEKGGDEAREYLKISPSQAEELYNLCILPDAEDSSLGTGWFYMDERAYSTLSNVEVNLLLEQDEPYDLSVPIYDSFRVTVTLDAERTLAWLEENLGIEAKPYLEVRPDVLEDLEYY